VQRRRDKRRCPRSWAAGHPSRRAPRWTPNCCSPSMRPAPGRATRYGSTCRLTAEATKSVRPSGTSSHNGCGQMPGCKGAALVSPREPVRDKETLFTLRRARGGLRKFRVRAGRAAPAITSTTSSAGGFRFPGYFQVEGEHSSGQIEAVRQPVRHQKRCSAGGAGAQPQEVARRHKE
jgi:hypothetical protein